MKRLLILLLATCSCILAGAQTGSLSGDWRVELEASGTSDPQTCTFAQSGSALSGTCTSKAGGAPVTGTVEGKSLTWTVKTASMVGPVTTVYKGRLDSDNRISGVIDALEFKMESDFHATRYKLVWSDEFNTDGRPDPKRWTFEEGFIRNNEAQWYQPQNG